MEDLKLGRAMLIAPLVTPVLYIIGVYLFSRDVPAGIKDVLSALLFVSAFALPISYVCTIVIGLPVLIWLKNNNALTVTTLTSTGLIAGGIVFTGFVVLLAGFDTEILEFPQIAWYLAAGGAMGGGVAYTFSKLAGITSNSTGRAKARR